MANYGKYSVANRLLLLKQYLEANAGRNHVVSRQELEDYLRGHEITVEKRTIYSDLAALEGFCGLLGIVRFARSSLWHQFKKVLSTRT